MPCPCCPTTGPCALCHGTGTITQREAVEAALLVDRLLRRYPEATAPVGRDA